MFHTFIRKPSFLQRASQYSIVADPVLFWPLDPGRKNSDSESGINIPDPQHGIIQYVCIFVSFLLVQCQDPLNLDDCKRYWGGAGNNEKAITVTEDVKIFLAFM